MLNRRHLLGGALAALAGATTLASQAEAQPFAPPPGPRRPPPPPPLRREEPRGRPPSRVAVWEPGHWTWRGGRYDWVPGHWVGRRPRGAWREGRWVMRGGRWVWVEPGWR